MRHPEWWTLVLAAVAWLAMLRPAAHCHHHAQAVSEEFGAWLLMVVAMMFPLLVDAVRRIAFRSYRQLRHPLVACLLTGYLAVWAVAGLATLVVSRLEVPAWSAFLAAAAWGLAPWRRFVLDQHHTTRALAPGGPRAFADAIGEGARIGGWCVLACWPLMVACNLTGHATVAMSGGFAIGLLERRTFVPRIREAAVLSLILAGIAAL